ncbi:MAG: 16S rRNA (cytidine(1402)-2'-O)-methyltransferase [bacterium]|nr:16S rRNA (cytidine(1402)-2'-O)-methyltransferase [bacterium]
MSTSSPEVGMLYIVATPIGNLEDITLRALRILAEVDKIAAEDTRRTRKLLTHHGISRPLLSYHEHNKRKQAPHLLALLQGGQHIALVTDAGTPGISDPGYYLLQLLIERDISVVPIPGPTAVIAALSIAGLPTDRFVFEGFLPPKGGKRRQRLEALRDEPRSIVIYESPYRLLRLLEEIATQLGAERRVVVTRELTKRFEEVRRGTVTELCNMLQGRTIRGECTVVIAGSLPSKPSSSKREGAG